MTQPSGYFHPELNQTEAGMIAEAQRQAQMNSSGYIGPTPSFFEGSRQKRQLRKKQRPSPTVRLAGLALWVLGALVLLSIWGAAIPSSTKPNASAPVGIELGVAVGALVLTIAVISWTRWMGRRRYARGLQASAGRTVAEH